MEQVGHFRCHYWIFWFVVLGLGLTHRILITRTHYRIWRLFRTLAVICLLAFFICAIIFVPSVGGGVGLKNFVLIVFANFSAAAVVTQFLMYVFPRHLLSRDLSRNPSECSIIFWAFSFSSGFSSSHSSKSLIGFKPRYCTTLNSRKSLIRHACWQQQLHGLYIDRSLERNNNNIRKEFQEKYARMQAPPSQPTLV
eukprot:jgi/Picre1/28982/NNA_004376.t1